MTGDIDIIRTNDGSMTVKHRQHGQLYHSTIGARTEARELYIHRSSFLDKMQQPKNIAVLDIGLGLGYNALTTIEHWQSQRAKLTLVSLESDEFILNELLSAKTHWQTDWPDSWKTALLSIRKLSPQHFHGVLSNHIDWHIILGDALNMDLSQYHCASAFDFFWHDPFSPEKNPLLWTEQWFAHLRTLAAPDSELLTYSVARTVKDALTAAGWNLERIPGMGAKKHWLKATLPLQS